MTGQTHRALQVFKFGDKLVEVLENGKDPAEFLNSLRPG